MTPDDRERAKRIIEKIELDPYMPDDDDLVVLLMHEVNRLQISFKTEVPMDQESAEYHKLLEHWKQIDRAILDTMMLPPLFLSVQPPPPQTGEEHGL